MQGYIATPNYYNDFIAHKDHKYLRKYLSPSGKMVYVYKRPAGNLNKSKNAYFSTHTTKNPQANHNANKLEEDYDKLQDAYYRRRKQIEEARKKAKKRRRYTVVVNPR